MSATAYARSAQRAGYRHEALLWEHTDALLARAVPFVQQGVDRDEPVMVAVTDPLWRTLRTGLGDLADEVHRVDITELGRNPARIIPALLEFIDRHGAGAAGVRGIGEPIWAGRRPAEITESQVHEALLNAAIPPTTPVWLLCPYDVTALDTEILSEACRSHPTVGYGGEAAPSQTYAGRCHPWALSAQDLPAPAVPTEDVAFGRGGLAAVRRLVMRHAGAAGLDRARSEDLVLAVNELAANSLDHGAGHGTAHAWREAESLVVEVRDGGRLANLLAGRVHPEPSQVRGRGLWMVHRLCDLVQVRSTPSGTVVRVVTWV